MKIRLAKKIAESGVASRREAERLIESGSVCVDDNVVRTPVFFVTDENKITVNGNVISKKSDEIIVWKFYKPKNVITSQKDPQGRKTVFDLIGPQNQRLIYIGRLDYSSEGLLLFTNNGDFARKCELPSTALERVYRVRFFGELKQCDIQSLKNGITIDGIRYGGATVDIETNSASNKWATIVIKEGKNREIRKMLEYFGCIVNRLIRVSYGPFKLGKLSESAFIRASKHDIDKVFKL